MTYKFEDDRIFSATELWDACYYIAQEAMASAFKGSKTIKGKTLEEFIDEFVENLEGS